MKLKAYIIFILVLVKLNTLFSDENEIELNLEATINGQYELKEFRRALLEEYNKSKLGKSSASYGLMLFLTTKGMITDITKKELGDDLDLGLSHFSKNADANNIKITPSGNAYRQYELIVINKDKTDHNVKYFDKKGKPIRFLGYHSETDNTLGAVLNIIETVFDEINIIKDELELEKEKADTEFWKSFSNLAKPADDDAIESKVEQIKRRYVHDLEQIEKKNNIYASILTRLWIKENNSEYYNKLVNLYEDSQTSILQSFYILVYTADFCFSILNNFHDYEKHNIWSEVENPTFKNETTNIRELTSLLLYCIYKIYNLANRMFAHFSEEIPLMKVIAKEINKNIGIIHQVETQIKQRKKTIKQRLKKQRQRAKRKLSEKASSSKAIDNVDSTAKQTLSSNSEKVRTQEKTSQWKETVETKRREKTTKKSHKHSRVTEKHKHEQKLKTGSSSDKNISKFIITPYQARKIERALKNSKSALHWKMIFGLLGKYDRKLSAEDLVKLAAKIDEKAEELCISSNFKILIKKHKHPNHGDGEGDKLPTNYIDAIRGYFIKNGFIPEGWNPTSPVDTKHFSEYNKITDLERRKKELELKRNSNLSELAKNNTYLYDEIENYRYNLEELDVELEEQLKKIQKELLEMHQSTKSKKSEPFSSQRHEELRRVFKSIKDDIKLKNHKNYSSSLANKIHEVISIHGAIIDEGTLTKLINMQSEITRMLADSNREYDPLPINMERLRQIEGLVESYTSRLQICTSIAGQLQRRYSISSS